MSKADDTFIKQFGAILGLLILFTICVYFIALNIGNSEFHKFLSRPSATAERISPVGSVRVVGDKVETVAAKTSAPAPPATTASANSSGKSGKDVYSVGCIACHATGVAGAPKFGDQAAWSTRAKTGFESMLKNVINGKGAMPPKGGTAFSAQELEKAVRYMLDESGVKL